MQTVYNVIDVPFFRIPLNQVCIPGLHITLGVYLKLFKIFEKYCCDVDLQIADLFVRNAVDTQGDFGQHVQDTKMLLSIQDDVSNLQCHRELLQSEVDWIIVTNGDDVNVGDYLEQLTPH